MRVLVMGSGGLGGYFGGVLARAGEDVTFVARGAHLEALRAGGLSVRSALAGDFSLAVRATDDPGGGGPVDLVIFAVKTYDLDSAAAQAHSAVGPRTMILPLQNGVDAPIRLGRYVPAQQILGAVSYVSSRVETPGVIVQDGGDRLLFGELGGGLSGRVERLADLLRRAGVAAEPRIDVLADLWEKFLMVCATSGVSALTRVTLGEVLACPEALELVRGLLVEGEAVARASRVGLSSDVVERLVGLLREFTPAARASMYYDVLAGRRLELEALSGAMVRRGRERGVPTPLTFAVYAMLKPYADGAG